MYVNKRVSEGGGVCVSVEGVDVLFPYTPYDCQLKYMEKVISSLSSPQTHALLESPTGVSA